MKIYLDGADRQAILDQNHNPEVSGFTTNPSLMRKSGVTDYAGFCQEILEQIKKPISFEVFGDSIPEMREQAKIIAAWDRGSNHVYVKIPVMNTQGQSMLPLARELSQQGVRLNITALFTIKQVYETASALAGGAPAIVSVFAGRIADSGRDPVPLVSACAEICREFGTVGADGKNTMELLWASTREVFNFVQAEQAGCAIITAPFELIQKRKGFGRSLDELTRDTVIQFKKDATAAGFNLK